MDIFHCALAATSFVVLLSGVSACGNDTPADTGTRDTTEADTAEPDTADPDGDNEDSGAQDVDDAADVATDVAADIAPADIAPEDIAPADIVLEDVAPADIALEDSTEPPQDVALDDTQPREEVSDTTTDTSPDTALLACPSPANGTVTMLPNLAYSGVHARNVLDLRLPPGTGPHPLLIWIHGGGWSGGSKDGVPAFVVALNRSGYAVASIEYRLSDHAWPAPVADVRAAVRWLRAHAAQYDLDPDAFAAAGSSAGGHLVAMLGVAAAAEGLDDPGHPNASVSPAVQAVVDLYGPTDIATMDIDAVANGCPEDALCHTCEGSPEAKLLDCPPASCSLAALASPVTWATENASPFVILHGSIDCTVPTPQSQRLHDALVAAGVPVDFVVVPGVGHDTVGVMTPENETMVRAFLDRTLRGCESTPNPTDPTDPPVPTVDACAAAACPAEAAACTALPACVAIDTCLAECVGTSGCVQSCVAGRPAPVVTTHKALFDCGRAAGCYSPGRRSRPSEWN